MNKVINEKIGIEEEKKITFISIIKSVKSNNEITLFLIILFISILMTFISPYFATWSNIRTILMSFTTEGLVVVGMTLILIVGGIDLSVGSVMSLTMIVAGKLFLIGINPWLASIIALVISAGIGAIMGLFVTKIGLNYFIVSLMVMVIARGLCFIITKGTPMSLYELPNQFKFIGQGSVSGMPFIIIIFTIIVITSDYMLRNSTISRKIFFTGSNKKAAIFSGINVDNTTIGVGIITSFLAGLAGILYMARFAAATANFGAGLELTAIAAAVIGGASLTGGRGSIFGSILGIALLSLMTSSMILMDVSVYWQDFVKGLILLLAVSYDQLTRRKREKV